MRSLRNTINSYIAVVSPAKKMHVQNTLCSTPWLNSNSENSDTLMTHTIAVREHVQEYVCKEKKKNRGKVNFNSGWLWSTGRRDLYFLLCTLNLFFQISSQENAIFVGKIWVIS